MPALLHINKVIFTRKTTPHVCDYLPSLCFNLKKQPNAPQNKTTSTARKAFNPNMTLDCRGRNFLMTSCVMIMIQIYEKRTFLIESSIGDQVTRADFRTVCTNRIGTTSLKKIHNTKIFHRCYTDTASTHCSEVCPCQVSVMISVNLRNCNVTSKGSTYPYKQDISQK